MSRGGPGGGVDHPESLTPNRRVHESDRIPRLVMNDGLPRQVGDSRSPRVAERSVGVLPSRIQPVAESC